MSSMDKEYDPEQGLPNPEGQEAKDTGNLIGGSKASLANSGHSDAAKQEQKDRLNTLAEGGREGFDTSDSNVGKPSTE